MLSQMKSCGSVQLRSLWICREKQENVGGSDTRRVIRVTSPELVSSGIAQEADQE